MTPHAEPFPQPARVAALLGHGMSEDLAARLLASSRLAARLDGVLQHRLGPLPALDAAQARALDLDAPGWALLQRQAGAVWHGRAIAAVVNGDALRELVAEIGEGLRALALRGRALAQPAGAVAAADLAAAIPSAGARCVAAWCSAQPDPVRARIALRLPGELPAAEGPEGAAVVAWLFGPAA